ncbi:hypothetical protein M426DRAFT_13453 [Hypoxylon sp. CI-4A]|nr:hypothetical protein M426DRAFT_13453 [Hypoxylon sp. CI-4A]
MPSSTCSSEAPKKEPKRNGYIRCQCICSKGREAHIELDGKYQPSPTDPKRLICGGCLDRAKWNNGTCG